MYKVNKIMKMVENSKNKYVILNKFEKSPENKKISVIVPESNRLIEDICHCA